MARATSVWVSTRAQVDAVRMPRTASVMRKTTTMSDDIVTRLRKPLPYNLVGLTTKDLGNERYEAADEIERLRADRDRWAKWGEHVFTCHNKGINPCYDCVSPVTRDAINRVDKGGKW